MSEPIKPALTAEEWARKYRWPANIDSDGDLQLSGAEDSYFVDGQERHALAALALYGQSFGFTREDVNAVLTAAGITVTHPPVDEVAMLGRLQNLADRIEALLPPE